MKKYLNTGRLPLEVKFLIITGVWMLSATQAAVASEFPETNEAELRPRLECQATAQTPSLTVEVDKGTDEIILTVSDLLNSHFVEGGPRHKRSPTTLKGKSGFKMRLGEIKIRPSSAKYSFLGSIDEIYSLDENGTPIIEYPGDYNQESWFYTDFTQGKKGIYNTILVFHFIAKDRSPNWFQMDWNNSGYLKLKCSGYREYVYKMEELFQKNHLSQRFR